MKKKLFGALVSLVIVAGGVFASGWAPRELGSMRARVIGHWEDPARTTHLYFGPIDSGTGQGRFVKEAPRGVEQGTWKMRAENLSKGELEMKITLPRGKEDRVLEIAPTGQSMTFAGQILVLKLDARQFTYVVASTSPNIWTPEELKARVLQFL